MATMTNPPIENFEAFLQQHLNRGLLRFSTAGSVDDGKSTLIGRLLHDTKGVYDDQLAALKSSRLNRSSGPIDFSLLTDGLKAEREQGITIDVAYRYFATPRRKFIIADTPGHEQYTRNMATGASTADLSIVLIDAVAFERNGGLLPQSRRHTFIASLLGIPHIVAAVNKMDLIGYDEARYRRIESEFVAFAARLGITSPQVIPISALAGDNVVERGANTPWYTGPTLLEQLEGVALHVDASADAPLRFPVQLVVRPDAEFRGYAGQIAGGQVRPGDTVVALPSGRETTVRRIVTWDGDLALAHKGMSVTLELADQIDLSRGEMLVARDRQPHASRRFAASVVWMHETPLQAGGSYLIKHQTRTVRARVTRIRHRVDIHSLEPVQTATLGMNEIAEVEFEAARPIFFDAYRDNRATGSLILIDPIQHATLGAGMLIEPLAEHGDGGDFLPVLLQVTAGDREREAVIATLRRWGRAVVSLDDEQITPTARLGALRALQLAGASAITALDEPELEGVERFLKPEQTVVLTTRAEVETWLERHDAVADWSI